MPQLKDMLPVGIANFNLYVGAERYSGVGTDIKMPELEALSETLSGAGILGEIKVGNPGHFGELPVEIPFNTLDYRQFEILKNSAEPIILRGASQYLDPETSELKHFPVKVTFKGPRSGLGLGTMGVGKPTGATVTIDALYIKIEVDGEVYTELDKLNWKFILNGVDQLADITPHM